MKNIAEKVLANMELVDRYLSGRMSEREALSFQERLEVDEALREDLALAKEVLGYGSSPWWKGRKKTSNITKGIISDRRLQRKMAVGGSLISYGLAIISTVFIMLATCLLVMLILH